MDPRASSLHPISREDVKCGFLISPTSFCEWLETSADTRLLLWLLSRQFALPKNRRRVNEPHEPKNQTANVNPRLRFTYAMTYG